MGVSGCLEKQSKSGDEHHLRDRKRVGYTVLRILEEGRKNEEVGRIGQWNAT